MNHKHEALWPLKNYKLYIVCTLILSNLFHLIVGSRLILTQNELWVPNCCYINFKVFLLVFKISKEHHHDFNLVHIIILIIITFLGEKWFTLSVLSPKKTSLGFLKALEEDYNLENCNKLFHQDSNTRLHCNFSKEEGC